MLMVSPPSPRFSQCNAPERASIGNFFYILIWGCYTWCLRKGGRGVKAPQCRSAASVVLSGRERGVDVEIGIIESN